MTDVIKVEDVVKRYGEVVAVDGVSFAVRRGEIFVIVGPNGAGKTTTVEMMAGLRRQDGGKVRLLELDPWREAQELRRRVGVQLQQAALPDRMKVWEALDLFASFYPQMVACDGLLETWGLAEKRNATFTSLSGGQKQRLFIALALLNDPELVFLDEITTGLDPQARRATWEVIRSIREQGKTVVLVTHFMEEAEVLADRVAIIDEGKLVALDSPQALIGGLQAGSQVRFTANDGFDATGLKDVKGVVDVVRHGSTIEVRGNGPLLVRVASRLSDCNVEPLDIDVHRPTLEDVFLAHTGREIRT